MTLDVFSTQKAIRDRLLADATLMAKITGIHDRTPQGAAVPYLVFGPSRQEDWSTATTEGAKFRLQLHAWSADGGRKEAGAILERARTLLHLAPLTVPERTVALVRCAEILIATREDGRLFEGMLAVDAWVYG